MKKTMTILAAALFCTVLAAQDFSSVLARVEDGNTTLRALRGEADAAKLDARTGNTPANPTVESGYLWGTPADMGNRVDLNVMQEFDFPTAYLYRKKIADAECSVAEYEYAVQRKAVLLEAEKVCIDIVYHRALARELSRRMASAERIASSWQEKFDGGSAGILDLNKAKLNLLNIGKEADANSVELDAAVAELARLCGGEAPAVVYDSFDDVMLPTDFEAWYSMAESVNPALQSIASQIDAAGNNVRLATSESLPKFSVGYVSERIAGTTLQGIGGGISIPLWENKGRVKAARARVAALESRREDACAQFYNSLKIQYEKALSLREVVADYREMLAGISSMDLLDLALEKGEISLVDYVMEQDIWYEAVVETLDNERDFHYICAELNQWSE